MTRMLHDAAKAILQALCDAPNKHGLEEWWNTDREDSFVVVDLLTGHAYRVTVEEVPVPQVSPSDVEAGAPHPFGWERVEEGES